MVVFLGLGFRNRAIVIAGARGVSSARAGILSGCLCDGLGSLKTMNAWASYFDCLPKCAVQRWATSSPLTLRLNIGAIVRQPENYFLVFRLPFVVGLIFFIFFGWYWVCAEAVVAFCAF